MTSPRASRSTRILIVDDHPIFREGLRMLLAQDATLSVVGEAGDATEAIAEAARLQPDILLLDVNLAGLDALPTIGSLKRAAPKTAVIVMTGMAEADLRARALQLGARGFIAKHNTVALMLKAIRKVQDGELWFDRGTVSTVVGHFLHEKPDGSASGPDEPLTDREREIAGLVGEGLRNEAIARRLAISEKTVRNNLTVIYEKVGVSDRLHLAIYAYRRGLARLPQ